MLVLRSCFFYGYTVDANSNTIRVDEGSGFIDIIVPNGKYALSRYINAVSNALNKDLTQEYIVSVDRNTRLITISSTSSFDLLIGDISTIGTAFPVMGFTGANVTGQSSYTGNVPSGKAYFPQMPLQELVDFNHSKEYIDGVVKESANGNVEVVSFGLKEYAEFNIKWASSNNVGEGNYMENNPTGYQDLVDFMDYLITKGQIEIMFDRDNREDYDIAMLESANGNKAGIGYTLKENFQTLGFYETGKLKFRRI